METKSGETCNPINQHQIKTNMSYKQAKKTPSNLANQGPPFPVYPQHQQLTYGVNSSGGAQESVRVRNPGDTDVLCGRGGGINAHPGNIAFRNMIKEKKERYSVASNKAQKSTIAQTILDSVNELGGRFLQRDNTADLGTVGTLGLWVEVDHEKALAKTSQALREGAPVIRAKALKSDIGHRTKTRKSSKTLKKRSRNTSTGPYEYAATDLKEENEKHEEVIHPIIRGFADGHRGKQIIPVFRPSPEKKLKIEIPDQRASECPTPPPADNMTPTLLSMPPLGEPGKLSLDQNHEPSSVASSQFGNFDWSSGLPTTKSSHPAGVAERQQSHETLSVLEPIDLIGVIKPDMRCVRVPSLTHSEWGLNSNENDDFLGDPFQNPFSTDDNHNSNGNAGLSDVNHHGNGNAGLSDVEFINDINQVLRSKSMDSTTTARTSNGARSAGEHDADRNETSNYQSRRNIRYE